MNTPVTKCRWTAPCAALILAALLSAGTTLRAAGQEAGSQVKPVPSEKLPNTEPASLLAVFVADDGARLTTFGK